MHTDISLNKLVNLFLLSMTYQLKEASVNDAKATPPTIGIRDSITQIVGTCIQIQ